MDEVQPITAHTRVGVECLTLWMEPDRVSAALHIALLKQDPDEADGMIVGLLNLNAMKRGLLGGNLRIVTSGAPRGGPLPCCTQDWIYRATGWTCT